MNGEYARGLFDDSDSGMDPQAHGFAFIGKGNAQANVRIQAEGYPIGIFQLGQPLPTSGHFLVRNSGAIPERGSVVLLALAEGKSRRSSGAREDEWRLSEGRREAHRAARPASGT